MMFGRGFVASIMKVDSITVQSTLQRKGYGKGGLTSVAGAITTPDVIIVSARKYNTIGGLIKDLASKFCSCTKNLALDLETLVHMALLPSRIRRLGLYT